jgi:DNA-binding response OmpR family regulator
MRILVVEDEAIIARDIQNILSDCGYQVTDLASSGEESIRKAEAQKPDLVLMDVRLKGPMDGIEAGHTIHDRFQIPIVLVTAFGDELAEEMLAGRKNGFLRIVKPFEAEEFLGIIRKLLPREIN